MSTFELNHFALITHDIHATIEFYTKYLGLELGPCLEGGYGKFLYFPGTNHAVIHMLDIETANKIDNSKTEGFQLYATPPDNKEQRNTNALDHLSFTTTKQGFDELISKLEADEVPYRLGEELAPKNLQAWIYDPNGIKIEVGCFPEKEKQKQL